MISWVVRTLLWPRRAATAGNGTPLSSIWNAGGRLPLFWMLVRDEAPERAYVQLMKSYKADPSLLARELAHRARPALSLVAQNLTILLWSDFSELVCGPGWDSESAAVKQELERRIVISSAKTV